MTYWAFLVGHPLFWAFVTGGALGCSVASATRLAGRYRRPARARSRKWTAASLWLTVAVVGATCGVFLAGATPFLRLPSLYVGAGAAGFFLLALRFPRAAGIPALVVLAVVAVAGALVMRPFVPVREETTVATVTLISSGQRSFIEISDYAAGGAPSLQVVEVASPRLVAHVTSLGIADYLFFLGAHGGIALETVRSADDDAGSPVITVYADAPFVTKLVARVPLLSLAPVESDPATVNLLREYHVVGYPDGRVRIEEPRQGE